MMVKQTNEASGIEADIDIGTGGGWKSDIRSEVQAIQSRIGRGQPATAQIECYSKGLPSFSLVEPPESASAAAGNAIKWGTLVEQLPRKQHVDVLCAAHPAGHPPFIPSLPARTSNEHASDQADRTHELHPPSLTYGPAWNTPLPFFSVFCPMDPVTRL
ncbi:uncharacterized protein LY79DRAFT_574718 [Colletotrichum navitas]|uniref:Uncharacterized protein n=1 Tax=Colletotrichum navitas TaxID=681940 RepID=A0AAD8QFK7_9PEZI|nr:uncharacterized protein LY79DRAFT_574718 [Colletotrichum navitas]KAK1600403.1 hypothetical protein LY79DRAFT_574718 [Colletotrichum navitas]